MVERIAAPEEILIRAQRLYPESFHEKVSSKKPMEEFYSKAVTLSRVKELIESSRELVTVVDVAGGRGKVSDALKKLTDKGFNYVNVDISGRELGKNGGKHGIIGDIMHLPITDKTADAVFFIEIPIPLSRVRDHVAGMKAESSDETAKKEIMLEPLEAAIDSIYKLNLLEGIRVLKDGGVMVLGGTYKGQTRENVESTVEKLPLKLEEFKIVELDKGVVPLWGSYGIDIKEPKFTIASFKKTGDDIKELVALNEQVLYSSLDRLRRIDGFDKVLNEMRDKKQVA